MTIEQEVRKLGRVKRLDPLADKVDLVVRPLLGSTRIKNALSGTWLGHRLHPALTDVAIGSLAGATIIDIVAPRNGAVARRLLGIGVLTALPTAVAGLNDWVDVYEDGRRIGLVHAVGNTLALLCYCQSFRRRRRDQGRVLGAIGLALLMISGYVGGHLSYVLGVGVDHTAFQPRLEDWQDVAASVDVPGGALVRVTAGAFPLLLVRVDDHVYALADRCSHAGWGLAEGKLEGDCVTCPAHGSIFSIGDGAVRRGPAASPQATYEVREVAGRIQVRSN
jgi:nitrite reductase/ring-hydroxylating ferredoxin subunit/uncharacterized membrane protein